VGGGKEKEGRKDEGVRDTLPLLLPEGPLVVARRLYRKASGPRVL
jgi:hypothetical protein